MYVCARARVCASTPLPGLRKKCVFKNYIQTNLSSFFLFISFYGSYLRPPPNQGNSNAQMFAEAEINVRDRKNGVGQLRTEMLVGIRCL